MSECRYCRCSAETIGVARSSGTSLDIVACRSCGLTAFSPSPSPAYRTSHLAPHLGRSPSFDLNFEWRLFLARRSLSDGARALCVGAESPGLREAMAREAVELEQICSINAAELTRFSSASLDAVFIWDVLEFVEDWRAFLGEVRRIVKPEGLVAIRARDCASRLNTSATARYLSSGAPAFFSRAFVRRLYLDIFRSRPCCFFQDQAADSSLVAVGRSRTTPPPDSELDVLFLVHPHLFARLDDATGPRGRVLSTIDKLEERGVSADVSFSLRPVAAGYDVVHLLHDVWETRDTLSQMVTVKPSDARIVLSMIYLDTSETHFVSKVINDIFKIPGAEEREAYLGRLADGTLSAGLFRQGARCYARWNIEEDQRALLELSDHVICFSATEMRHISKNLHRAPPFSLVYNTASAETFGVASPDVFVERYGVKDFVIQSGHVEWRKNQLMLLYALRQHPEIPIVVIGASANEEYYELCRCYAHRNTIFIPQLKQRHLASAFAAARVHAQPSWIEGISLSTIEAAMCGCTPVVSDRAGEIEYYGDLGHYVNPGSVDSIRRAVLSAYHAHTPTLRERTSARVRSRYTFDHAASMTLDAYRRVLGRGAYRA
jgi:glycosyltransferase involved in cell wall biosynthesis